MKTYKISTEKSGIKEGIYQCKGSFMSYPFITFCDNYDMKQEELMDWMYDESPYILEVYDNTLYTNHGNAD